MEPLIKIFVEILASQAALIELLEEKNLIDSDEYHRRQKKLSGELQGCVEEFGAKLDKATRRQLIRCLNEIIYDARSSHED